MSNEEEYLNVDSPDWESYQLLDSGKGRKLEQFGPYRLIRPDPRVVWKAASPPDVWKEADAEFVAAQSGGGGNWVFNREIEKRWEMSYKDLRFWIDLAVSQQVGLFPENAAQWDWMRGRIREAGRPLRVLNLFGYTGLASLAAAKEGAAVTHVDSAKRAVRMGRENQALSGLEDKPIRWIVEDAIKFARREVKRGSHYDGLIMDPPKYGLGPKKERWEFFEDFETLCKIASHVLSDEPVFVVVTAYALQSEPDILEEPMLNMLDGLGGEFELGELVTQENSAGRKISNSIFGRWSAE